MDEDEQGLSPNVMSAQELADGLQATRYKANDNNVSYEADDSVAGSKISSDGLEDEMDSMHSMLGSKPSQPRESEAVQFKGISSDAMEAIRKKKANRKLV
jgi:hypothetical protein